MCAWFYLVSKRLADMQHARIVFRVYVQRRDDTVSLACLSSVWHSGSSYIPNDKSTCPPHNILFFFFIFLVVSFYIIACAFFFSFLLSLFWGGKNRKAQGYITRKGKKQNVILVRFLHALLAIHNHRLSKASHTQEKRKENGDEKERTPYNIKRKKKMQSLIQGRQS